MMNVRLQIGVKAESLLPKHNGIDPDRVEGFVPREEPSQKNYFSPPHTYTSCFGLPYQDHNYVAPPPPTPPASPPPLPPPTLNINGHIDIEDVSSNTEVVTTVVPPIPLEDPLYTPDDSITRCVCEFEHDDGYMICCDKCSVWQHVDCMGVDRDDIPDKYLCEKCEPREVDKPRARELQIRKREELAAILYAIDSSATETEDETIRLGINPARERMKKSKGKKKKERDKATKANQKKNKKFKKDKKQKNKLSPQPLKRKVRKKVRALSSNQQVKRPSLLSSEPATPEKKPCLPTPAPVVTPAITNTTTTSTNTTTSTTTTATTAKDTALEMAVVAIAPPTPDTTPTPVPAKRSTRRGSLKSPKSPARMGNKSPLAKPLMSKSPVKSPVAKSPVKSPVKSPIKSPLKSPVKSPIKSPVKSPVKSPIRSPIKSPIRSPIKVAPKFPAKSPVKESVAMNVDEDALHSWDRHLPEGYEEAKMNQYTSDVEKMISSKKLNGQHSDSDSESKPCERLLVQLCKISQVESSCKGLEVIEEVQANRVIIEYVGKVMLREQYDKDNIFFRRLQPYVLFYSDFENLDLCVNAESYGNDARFVRRSCTPNARVQHVVENGKVLFFIYSQTIITTGAEVTIPFDFDYQESNYDVQCACSLPGCPVSKKQKKEDKIRKKRSCRLSQREKKLSVSIDLPEESNSNVSVGNSKSNGASGGATTMTITSTTSSSTALTAAPAAPPLPAAVAPTKEKEVHGPPAKRRRITPLNVTAANKTQEEKVLVETVMTTMTRRRSARGEERAAEEERLAEEARQAPPPTPMSPEPSSSFMSDGEDEGSSEKRKMTREERKMEAILKAFEKLEKREERRKEALARLEIAKKSDKPEKEKDKVSKEVKEPPPQEKEEPKSEEVKPAPTTEQIPKAKVKKKGKHGTPSRRCSRVNSSASTTSGYTSGAKPPSTADESSSSQMAPAAAPPPPPPPPPLPPLTLLSLQTPTSAPGGCDTSTPQSVQNTPSTPSSAQQEKAFRFPKTKKHMMNEWLSEKAQDLQKPLTIKTEALEVNAVQDGNDKNAEFIKCVPSPHATPLSHLRRSSFSGGTHTPKSFNSPAASSQLDCNLGSAKKRWLRQAMFESTSSQPGTQQSPGGSMSPIPNGGMSPNPNSCANSPGASPHVGGVSHNVADFVTPLKKRRLARESISMDTPPYPPTPSTPTMSGSELPLSEAEKYEVLDNVRIKAEDGGTLLMNGFKAHLSPMTPAEHLFEHLSEERRSFYSEKQESVESSVSELLLTPSCNMTRERHESGRSDCRSDYRSEADTDTEDSRLEEVLRQNNGGDGGLGVPHQFEMIQNLALKAGKQGLEGMDMGVGFRMSSTRSDGDVFEDPVKTEQNKPEFKIELKPSDLNVLPSNTASFHPSLVCPGPLPESDSNLRDIGLREKRCDSLTGVREIRSGSFSGVREKCSDSFSSVREKRSDSFSGVSEKRSDTFFSAREKRSESFSGVRRKRGDSFSDMREAQSDCFSELKVQTEFKPRGVTQTPPGAVGCSSLSSMSEAAESCTANKHDDSDTSHDSHLNVGAGSSHEQDSSFEQCEEIAGAGSSHNSSYEHCQNVSDSGPPDTSHMDGESEQEPPSESCQRPGEVAEEWGDEEEQNSSPNAADNSDRSHCDTQTTVQQSPGEQSVPDECVSPSPEKGAVNIGEVASSTEGSGRQKHCGSDGVTSGSVPDNSDRIVTSHLDRRTLFGVLTPPQASLHSTTMPSQSDALVTSGLRDSCKNTPLEHHVSSPDQGEVSSDGDVSVVQNVEEGEVTSQAGDIAVCEGDGDEQASSESSMGEHSVGSSDKDSGAVTSEKRRNSFVEMQVSCSSDTPVATAPTESSEPEPSTSAACHSMVVDEDYELEEGECVSDTEKVTSMDISLEQSGSTLPSHVVSSSKQEDRVEHDMEVDLPDQSADRSQCATDACSSAMTTMMHARGSLPDTATTTSSSESEPTSQQQEPHSATTMGSLLLPTQSKVAGQSEATIDSTSGSNGPSAEDPAPSGSTQGDSGIVGDVSSSSTQLHPSLGCGSSVVNERTISSNNKDEEPSPSTSSPRGQVFQILRTQSISADHEAQSVTVSSNRTGSVSTHTEQPSESMTTASDSHRSKSVSVSANSCISSSTSCLSLPSPITSSSSVASSSTSPTGSTAAAPHAPTPSSSSGRISSIPVLQPPTRKRVSLLEYRKRMKRKGPERGPSSSSSLSAAFPPGYSSSSSSTSSSTSSSPLPSPGSSGLPPRAGSSSRDPRAYSVSPTKDIGADGTAPTLAPLPLFDKYGGDRHKGAPSDDEADSRWNTAATSVERVREQTLSLTERLRREFGVEAAESDAEEDERARGSDGALSGQTTMGHSPSLGLVPPQQTMLMGAPSHLAVPMGNSSHGQQQHQKPKQQQAGDRANMRPIMAISSYTSKQYNKRSGGPTGGSSNPGGPSYPYPPGQPYTPPSSTTQYNNLPPQNAPPYPRGGATYSHNHHPAPSSHHHQQPPPPPPSSSSSSSSASSSSSSSTGPQQAPSYTSAPYPSGRSAPHLAPPHSQYGSGGPPPPPPPPSRSYTAYPPQPAPSGNSSKMIRDYQHQQPH